MTDDMLYAEELVEKHWKYISDLLKAHDVPEPTIKIVEFHYKTSGLHFFKHALEYIENTS
jgi:hypothetical protein